MDQQEFFDLVVQTQSVLPTFRENSRAFAALDQMRRKLAAVIEPFTYSVFFTELSADVPQTQFIQIQADADFKIMSTQFEADIDGAAQAEGSQVEPLVNVLLTDIGNGRNLMDQAIPVTTQFGNGQLPFLWPKPKIMQARSTLQIQVTQFDGSTTDLRLMFSGVKLYPLAQ